MYDPDNPSLYQEPSEDKLIVIHKKEPKQQDCLLKKSILISFLDSRATYFVFYTKLLKKICNSRITSPQPRQFKLYDVVDDLYFASVIPSLVYKPWDIGEPNHKIILPRTHSNPYEHILCNSKIPEVEIDPGPLPLSLLHKQDQVVSKSDTEIFAMSNEIKTWTTYTQDLKFKVLFMFTMILLPLYKIMVPEEEIDPGPHPPSISFIHKLNYLPTLIISEVLVIFRTWIGYINKFISSYHAKFISPHVSSISQEDIIAKNYYKKAVHFIKQIYLYHDHYMIDALITNKQIYLYHDHYMIGILVNQAQTIDNGNLNHHKSIKTFHRKAVRFKK